MHSGGCVGGNLSDVFPSIPLQDSLVNGSVNGHLIGLNSFNSSVDIPSRIKYLGLNLPTQFGHGITNGSSFTNEDRSRTNLIINYLPQSYDQTDLQRLFERVGPIRQCKLIRDKNTGASLCYGFVDFVNPQHAALAIQTYHGYETEQKRLRVAYASSGGRRFTPGHRLPALSGGVSGFTNEVTNENIIGWEVFVVGIPLDWTESELLRLFANFGNVVLVRLLAPQLSESPPSHKARMGSPILNGASSDISSESADCGRFTTTASVIFEDKSSAEQSVLRLNGYHPPDWSIPMRLRIIGSVTRETYGLFCFSSRQSPALGPSRLPNSQNPADPLNESEVLSNLLNRKVLTASNCPSGNTFAKSLDTVGLSSSIDLHANPTFAVAPRAIIRNKGNDSTVALSHNLQHSHPLELLELLENPTNMVASTTSSLLNTTERLSTQNLTLSGAFAQRVIDQEHSKLDNSLRVLSGNQSASPWVFNQHRSLLNTLPDTVRCSDSACSPWSSSGVKRLSIKSPVLLSHSLTNVASQRGGQVQIWLKLENVQPTGSFKIRGMENVCRKWAASGVTHVVCPSGGNAAIAAAYCAQTFGLSCTVVTPEPCEAVIRRHLSIEAPDTKVVVHGIDWLEANHRAEHLLNELHASHSTESTVRLLHPYDQPDLWEGYEAIVDELGSEMGQPDVIVLPVGGGGLLAGIIQGLWNRGWSSTHVVAVETEGADCLNRSMKAGQLLLVPRSTSIATSLIAPVLAHRSWNLAQLQSLTPIVSTDMEALDAVKHFIDDHSMLVEPACGAALSVIYSGVISRLQLEGRIPRPANVVVILTGGRNVSIRQLADWENRLNLYGGSDHLTSFLPSLPSPILPNTSSHAVLNTSDLSGKQKQSFTFGQRLQQDPDETLKLNGSTSNTPCAVFSRTPTSEHVGSLMGDHDTIVDCGGALNPHDLVNFSKLLAPSETDADEVESHE